MNRLSGAAALAMLVWPIWAYSGPAPDILIEDVTRFYRLYDAENGKPTAEQLQRYIDDGSEGLRAFAKVRNVNGERIARAIAEQPDIYREARVCVEALPRVRKRLEASMRKLLELYPQARAPPVTIVIGRGKPIAVGSPLTGVQVGLEALCAMSWLNPDIEDRFVFVIAHEYAHVQQAEELADQANLTVLEASLIEGIAEFVAELTAGEVAYAYLAAMVLGRETEIETAFRADVDKTDLSDWLYNTKPPDTLGDVGYWVGYRIAKAYYQRAPDKRRALREILQMKDAKAFLKESGWKPGIELQ